MKYLCPVRPVPYNAQVAIIDTLYHFVAHLLYYILFDVVNTLIPIDTTELLRCNSMRKALNPAFSVVTLNGTCPIPTHLFIYKLCQGRLGITTEDEDMIPFPTDYLRIYQLTGNNVSNFYPSFRVSISGLL